MSVMVSELYEALRSAGVDDAQARAAAEAVLQELVTKADLSVAMAELKHDLIRVQIGTLVAMTAIYGGLVAALKVFA